MVCCMGILLYERNFHEKRKKFMEYAGKRVNNVLHDIQILEHKNYIKNRKESGYQSYHIIVSVPVNLSEGCINTIVEIQIRTIAMDFWASIEHKIRYKYEKDIPPHIQRELLECSDIVRFLDQKMF